MSSSSFPLGLAFLTFALAVSPARADPQAPSTTERETIGPEDPIPPAVPPPSAPSFDVGYDAGIFFQERGDRLRLKLINVIQPQLLLGTLEEGDTRDLEAAFLLRRVRFTLEGYALSPNLSFKLQVGFDRAIPALRDAFLEYAFVPGVLHVRAGKYKRPFSRQQIASGLELDLVERSITNDIYEAGRDVGVMASNDYEEAPTVEWALGVFNGFAEAPGVPPRFKPSLVGRLGYNSEDYAAYEEPDLEGGDLRWSVAGSARLDLDIDGGDDARLLTELDWIAKLHGFSTSGAVYVTAAQAGTTFPAAGLSSVGFFVQGGYVFEERYQPAIRYSLVVPFAGAPRLHEATAGFNLYFIGHVLKWQSEVSFLVEEGPGEVDVSAVGRTQITFVF